MKKAEKFRKNRFKAKSEVKQIEGSTFKYVERYDTKYFRERLWARRVRKKHENIERIAFQLTA